MANWSVPGYAEVRELGSGATGRVVLARHTSSGRLVAIKFLARRLASEPGFLDRFRREAELLARVRDPHVVRLFDYVEAREGAAIVMEAVEGPTLRRLLATSGPATPEIALTLLHGSLLGLAAAHSLGVVHRDYKPENVLIVRAGESKLADFGVSALSGADAHGLGTPAYMAPEQWGGAAASPASDMYAATVVFFECLTGRRPFAADSIAGLRRLHESAPAPVSEVPEAVRPLVALGMSKDPDQRYQDVGSFVAHLERVAVAGYGPDWRERGTRDLAVAAAVLIAVFPLLASGFAGAAGMAGAGVGGANVAFGSSAIGGGFGSGAGGAAGIGSGAAGSGGVGSGSAASAGRGAGRGARNVARKLRHVGTATAKVKAIVAAVAVAVVATTATVATVSLSGNTVATPLPVAVGTSSKATTTSGHPTSVAVTTTQPAVVLPAPGSLPGAQAPTQPPTDGVVPTTARPPKVTTTSPTTLPPTAGPTTIPPTTPPTTTPVLPSASPPTSPPTTTSSVVPPATPKLSAKVSGGTLRLLGRCDMSQYPTFTGSISSDTTTDVTYHWHRIHVAVGTTSDSADLTAHVSAGSSVAAQNDTSFSSQGGGPMDVSDQIVITSPVSASSAIVNVPVICSDANPIPPAACTDAITSDLTMSEPVNWTGGATQTFRYQVQNSQTHAVVDDSPWQTLTLPTGSYPLAGYVSPRIVAGTAYDVIVQIQSQDHSTIWFMVGGAYGWTCR